ncbi:hypothetical protein WG936_06560 [Corynebacterium sp. H127]|uniref:hypothetical protein n=1 Tax=Corynebacterium sp. H127 TaxID=3133418 RepID=UPI0030A9926F
MYKVFLRLLLGALAMTVVGLLMAFFLVDTTGFAIAMLMVVFGFPLTIMFGVFTLIAFLLPRNVAKNWTDGKVGVGRVRDYHHMYRVNNRHVYRINMQVEGEDGAIFAGSLKSTVGSRRLSKLTPNTMIPVIYQASKPEKLYVPHGPLQHRAQLFYDYACQREGILDQQTLNAQYWGNEARAIIADMQQTGRKHEDALEWNLSLNVTTPTGQQFPASARLYLTEEKYLQLRNASYVEVKYLPADPSVVAVRIPKEVRR